MHLLLTNALITFQYEPTVGNLLLGRQLISYMHVRRIDTKSVPDGDKESNEWLQNLFREKDELQESFHKHGDFFTGSRFEKVEPVLMQRRISSLLNTVGWMFVTLTPILYYLVKLLFSGELLYFSFGAGILLVCKFFFGKKLILIHHIESIFLLQSIY